MGNGQLTFVQCGSAMSMSIICGSARSRASECGPHCMWMDPQIKLSDVAGFGITTPKAITGQVGHGAEKLSSGSSSGHWD